LLKFYKKAKDYFIWLIGVDDLKETKLINRKKAREEAFILLFENSFNSYSLDEILKLKSEIEVEEDKKNKTEKIEDFTKELFEGVKEHQEEIDSLINEHSKAWSKDRISKIAMSILRLSIFEILFREDIPSGVSINEAVELAKKYGSDEEPGFINGILGSISRKN